VVCFWVCLVVGRERYCSKLFGGVCGFLILLSGGGNVCFGRVYW